MVLAPISKKKLLFLFFVFLSVASGFAFSDAGSKQITLLKEQSKYQLKDFLYYQSSDKEGVELSELDPNGRWFTIDDYVLNKSKNVTWYKIRIANQSEADSKWFLVIDNPLSASIVLYFIFDTGEISSLIGGVNNKRGFEANVQRKSVFPINIPVGQSSDVIIRSFNGSSKSTNMMIFEKNHFQKNIQQHFIFYGSFIGAISALVLFLLFFYIFSRDISQLLLLAMLVSQIFIMISFFGVGHHLLWSENSIWNRYSVTFFSGLALVFLGIFGIKVSKINTNSFVFMLFLSSIVFIGIVLSISTFIFSELKLLLTTLVFFMFSNAVVLTLGLYKYFFIVKEKGALFIFLGAFTFLMGLFLYFLGKIGVIVGLFNVDVFLLTGILLQAYFFSFVLIDKFMIGKREQELLKEDMMKEIVKREEVERELLYKLTHDTLTSCPNRQIFEQFLGNLIGLKQNKELALVFITLRNFKEINNTLGYAKSMKLLRLLIQKIQRFLEGLPQIIRIDNTIGGESTIATLESITFAVLLSTIDQDVLVGVCNKLNRILNSPLKENNMLLGVGGYLGIVNFPDHGKCASELIQRAFVAVEIAEQQDEDMLVYNMEIDPYSARRLSLANDLKKALASDQLQVYFQPQLELSTELITGFEALARWRHSRHGFVPPDHFVALAEQTGIISKLTNWVLRKSVLECVKFRKKSFNVRVSVNLSVKNLKEKNIVTDIVSILQDYNMPSDSLVLEITETAMMSDPEQARKTLISIHEQGIGLAIDDFGTGYSSLAYLKRLPVREIKIDRSFVMDMCSDTDDQVIVNTTLNMSHNLGLSVTAEGVEKEETFLLLKRLGCDVIQGYFICKPLSRDELIRWLKKAKYNMDKRSITKN